MATLPVPADPPLKDARSFRLVGTRAPRLDTQTKVTGAAVYGIDVKVTGMLVGNASGDATGSAGRRRDSSSST